MCTCQIIPEIVLEELKKQGVHTSKEDIERLQDIKVKRVASMMMTFAGIHAAMGSAKRLVYDCKHGTAQRVNLKRSEGGAVTGDVDIDRGYDNAGVVRDYFKTQLNWNSIDNNGLDLIFNVHYSNHFNNAYWDGDDMTFGDGDGTNFTGFARALDVAGHELTHGVVQYTARLVYDAQPGALNEHMADVFGTVIKQYGKHQDEHTANWLMGDEIMIGPFHGRAIRSMKDPASAIALSAQPDHMSHYYAGPSDNHGVHINSGIPNKAFYLVAMSIGTFKAAKLWFAALKKLKPTSKFLDLYNALKAETPALVSNHTVPANTPAVLQQAFHTVGII